MNRLLRLQAGESGLVFALAFLLFTNSLAMQIAGIVSVSGFLSSVGVDGMLVVYIVDYTLIFLSGALQTLIVDRFNRIHLVAGMSLIFALVFGVIRLMFLGGAPEWLNYGFMFLMAEQQLVFFPLIFWVLANDLFSMEQAKRIFPLISSGGFLGELAGIGLAAVSPIFFASSGWRPEEILDLNVILYVVVAILFLLITRKLKIRQIVKKVETVRENLSEGWGFVKEVPSFRFLTLSILLVALASIILEFRFLTVTSVGFPDQASYQSFFSFYRLAIVLASFVMQTFFTGRIIGKWNLKNMFFVLPVVTLIGAGIVLAVPGVAPIVGVMWFFYLVRFTLHDSSVKAFEALVPEERRGRVSTFVDGYVPAAGIVLGCILAGGVLLLGKALGIDLYLVYLACALLAAGVTIFFTYRMRSTYDASLLNWRLKRRQRASSSALDKLTF